MNRPDRLLADTCNASDQSVVPALDGRDLLYGVKEIANHLGRSEKQVRHWVRKGLIPTGRMGGTICSTKSGLARHFAVLVVP